jgi:hypothetical protein
MMKVGDKIKFKEEKTPYRIRAMSNRFAVCTRPFNPQRTVIYTVLDFEHEIRGPENTVFGMGAETDEQCQEMLKRFESGEGEVSHRNNIPLNYCVLDSTKPLRDELKRTSLCGM